MSKSEFEFEVKKNKIFSLKKALLAIISETNSSSTPPKSMFLPKILNMASKSISKLSNEIIGVLGLNQ